MAANYLGMFNVFFSRRISMSSTYKPILLRALLDMGDLDDPKKRHVLVGREWLKRSGGRLEVDLNFVAARFAKYYWDMEYSFHLKQAVHPKDASIVRLIKEQHMSRKKPQPPTVDELAGDGMAGFRKDVINRIIKPQPLRYLLTDMPYLYVKSSHNSISFDEDIVEFMHKHRTVLRKGINNILTKYLERLNHATPSIANKVDCEFARRAPLSASIRIFMKQQQDSKCFYCQSMSDCFHVDHVIPYNYVFTTVPYNCILACQRCNCIKSDRLPHRDIFEGVLERNSSISGYLGKFKPAYEKGAYKRLFDACEDEYHNKSANFFTPENRTY